MKRENPAVKPMNLNQSFSSGHKEYTEAIEYYEQALELFQRLDKLGCTEGWLIVFDRRKTISWGTKIFWQIHEGDGKTIHIVGC